MAVPADILAFWPYDESAPSSKPIPSGWERATAYDGNFLVGYIQTLSPGLTGGGSHYHVLTPHSHTGATHNHALDITGTGIQDFPVNTASGSTNYSREDHGHFTGASSNANVNSNQTTHAGNAASPEPQYIEMIIIRLAAATDPTTTDLPVDVMAFADTATMGDAEGWATCDGTGGTFDLGSTNRFIKGAPASTTTSAYTHTGGTATHTHTASSHTHTTAAHTHSDGDYGTPTGVSKIGSGGLRISKNDAHHHSTNASNETPSLNSTSVGYQAGDHTPAYHMLLARQNRGGGASTPIGVILPFSGALGTLEKGWVYCDGTRGTPNLNASKMVRATKSSGSIGTTGGSNSHGHAVDSTHTHTVANHTHTDTPTTDTESAFGTADGAGVSMADGSAGSKHTHSSFSGLQSSGGSSTGTELSSIQWLTGLALPPYKTVHWVKRQPATVAILGGKVLGGRIL